MRSWAISFWVATIWSVRSTPSSGTLLLRHVQIAHDLLDE